VKWEVGDHRSSSMVNLGDEAGMKAWVEFGDILLLGR
jgi:hypothetical protein